jgi:hypothetical protein
MSAIGIDIDVRSRKLVEYGARDEGPDRNRKVSSMAAPKYRRRGVDADIAASCGESFIQRYIEYISV